MTNHYQLVVETPDGNLARGMRQLNGVYTQYSNRRHQRVRHLFHGRYQAILVHQEGYLQELSRYVVLNPVRAGMTRGPDESSWNSYFEMTGNQPARDRLQDDALLARFGAERALASIEAVWKDCDQAVVAALDAGAYSDHQITGHFAIPFRTVRCIVRAGMKARRKPPTWHRR
jgi:hypothetical protein